MRITSILILAAFLGGCLTPEESSRELRCTSREAAALYSWISGTTIHRSIKIPEEITITEAMLVNLARECFVDAYDRALLEAVVGNAESI